MFSRLGSQECDVDRSRILAARSSSARRAASVRGAQGALGLRQRFSRTATPILGGHRHRLMSIINGSGHESK